MRSYSHLNSAQQVLEQYRGEMPLAEWLRQFFRQHKKYGSKDRKIIAGLCYAYYRLGGAAKNLTVEEGLLTAIFLTTTNPHPVLAELRPEWNDAITQSLEEKLSLLQLPNGLEGLFPFSDELSPAIDADAFTASLLIQPDLFLRLRPGHAAQVEGSLQAAGIPFTRIKDDCLALPNGTKTEELIAIDRDAVVQDLSSQEVINPYIQHSEKDPQTIWDCCAASGGKSILFYDRYPRAELTVSDIRESIIANLRKRFERAGITRYRSFLADLSSPSFKPPRTFDLVICDAPCSGSGTWGRTPEQLRFFKKEEIERYAQLQRKIARKAAAGVGAQGKLLYITCSVFKKENEDAVAWIEKETGLKALSMDYFRGYHRRSDTLFAALFSAL